MFENAYANTERAEAYAKLEFPGTYNLAYRDLPDVLGKHIKGRRALDFGCGAGRSTRFLRRYGFSATGIDVAGEMLARARHRDPEGDYRLIPDGRFETLGNERFDLILCAFPFDNVPNERKTNLFRGLRTVLANDGRIVVVGSTPEIYLHEWVSFSTSQFPENQKAGDGDIVRIINTSAGDTRPVEDIVCSDRLYREIFHSAGLGIVEKINPLGREDDQIKWVTETRVAPWVIYVLHRSD
jgi:SAM-dependent methyltransferase